MDPEEGGGSFLQARFMGIPAWVILAGAAVLAYLYFSHQSSSANRPTTTGGGGRVTTGKTVVQSGAVSINVGSGEDNDLSVPGNHQPKPPVNYTGPLKAITVPKDENFTDLAGSRNWSEETIGDVENLTQPKGPFKGKKLRPDTQLHKGDVIYRPIGRGKKEQGI